jgi:hypothetical protein
LLNGLAADVANDKPEQFPMLAHPSPLLPIQPVVYNDSYKVSYIKGKKWSVYPKDRTKEHFMTLSFAKKSDGVLSLQVEAWTVRELNSHTGLPEKGFSATYITEMRKSAC